MITTNRCDSSLFLTEDPSRRVAAFPSIEEFKREVAIVFQEKVRRGTGGFIIYCPMQLMNRLLENEVTFRYLTRPFESVSVNQFGIPEYNEDEAQIYRMTEIPYRKPELNENGSVSRTAYSAFIQAFPLLSMPTLPMSKAFNYCGTSDDDINMLLSINFNQFESLKQNSNNNLTGTHYVDEIVSIADIFEFIKNIESNQLEFELDQVSQNIIIFALKLEEMSHVTCGVLVLESKDISNPIARELFLMDSERMNTEDYEALGDEFEVHCKRLENHSPMKFTYCSYGPQIQNSEHAYNYDGNCVFYTIRCMNGLVEIIGSSQESLLRARLLGQRRLDEADTSEDIAAYRKELEEKLVEYFDYDQSSESYAVKSFEARKAVHMNDRWTTGNIVLKVLRQEMAAPSPAEELV